MKKDILRNFDYLLFGVMIILSVFGIVMIRSAIAGNEFLQGYPTRQTQFLVVSIVVIVIVTLVDYRYLKAASRYIYIFILVFLALIFIAGQISFGAQRWLTLGDLNLQPAELAKMVIILVLANYFSQTKNQPHDFMWILRSILLVGGVVIWILLQPNLSTSIVIFVIWFAMIWINGIKPKYLIYLGVIALVFAVIFVLFIAEDYQLQRVIQFAFPDEDARHGNEYNVRQALIAIGSGGLFGQGYGQGRQVQLRYLQVRQTDYIFSAMAEEFGFVGVTVIIGLLLFLIYRCIRVANLASDEFGAMIAYGVAILLFFQMAVNIGVNLNVIPVTGLTLPFISYGGSSLASLSLGIGLVESVAAHRKT